jgi:hypothetical protein
MIEAACPPSRASDKHEHLQHARVKSDTNGGFTALSSYPLRVLIWHHSTGVYKGVTVAFQVPLSHDGHALFRRCFLKLANGGQVDVKSFSPLAISSRRAAVLDSRVFSSRSPLGPIFSLACFFFSSLTHCFESTISYSTKKQCRAALESERRPWRQYLSGPANDEDNAVVGDGSGWNATLI